jgi:uncharacterized protein (DUF305 family)
MPDTQKMMQGMVVKQDDPASTKAFKEAHMKMMTTTPREFTGKADVDFIQSMIPHHQGAIDMAKIELEHGSDPQIKQMAQKIISDQEKEIAQMQAWLKKNKN